MVGGVMASIQPDEIEKATGIRPHIGTLHTPHKDIDKDNPYIIDELPLDYSILDEIDYVYPDSGAYYSYSTRGCIRKCPFCAVWRIEPEYQEYLPLRERIDRTRKLYGEQQNLLLMDNNVLASNRLEDIIEDIKSADLPKVLNIMNQTGIQLLSEIFVWESITVHIFANHSSYFKN